MMQWWKPYHKNDAIDYMPASGAIKIPGARFEDR